MCIRDSPRIAMYSLYDTWGFPCVFPHSEISGSLAMCAYPKLIAAYHVLHRLLMPRHSPCALCSLTFTRLLYLITSSTVKSIHSRTQVPVSYTHLDVYKIQASIIITYLNNTYIRFNPYPPAPDPRPCVLEELFILFSFVIFFKKLSFVFFITYFSLFKLLLISFVIYSPF